MVRLIPRSEKFLDEFRSLAGVVREAAAGLRELLERFDRVPERVKAMKEIEHRGDKITHSVIEGLARTFITPFDREDIHKLATDLDDVVDAIDNAAHHVLLYRIDRARFGAVELARILEAQAEEIGKAVARLGVANHVAPHCVEINRLENEGDKIYREATERLFLEEKDPITLIKWKELLENLERATDECEDVANDLQDIYLKYG